MRFVIPILVGAIIGYTTNWIAIRMLFRPYEEKRILGFHIPFTPGLIPKERRRIARKVGEVIGEYLLSEEVIKNWLRNNNLEKQIEKWIEIYINNLKNEERTLKALFFKDNNDVINRIKEKATDLIYTEINREEFKKTFIKLIRDYIIPESLASLYDTIDEKLEVFLYDLVISNELQNLIRGYILDMINRLTKDERILKEVIPENLVNAVKRYIINQEKHIVNILKYILDDPSVEMHIKRSIISLAAQNMNKLVAFFINPETISNIVYKKLKENLDNPEFSQNIIHGLIVVLDRVMEERISVVAEEIISEFGEEKILQMCYRIRENISNRKDPVRNIAEIIGENIKSKDEEIQRALIKIISQEIERIISSQELYDSIYSVVDRLVESILRRPISSITMYLNESFISKAIILINYSIDKFIEKNLPILLQLFNVSKVVEDEINKYDVAFTEELILQIAHKELKAITWLGGLLGGIIGVLTPLFQMIR